MSVKIEIVENLKCYHVIRVESSDENQVDLIIDEIERKHPTSIDDYIDGLASAGLGVLDVCQGSIETDEIECDNVYDEED